MSRATQGVTLINLEKGEKLAGLSRIAETEDDDAEDVSDDIADAAE
jgi:DNA gyrase subunit A